MCQPPGCDPANSVFCAGGEGDALEKPAGSRRADLPMYSPWDCGWPSLGQLSVSWITHWAAAATVQREG